MTRVMAVGVFDLLHAGHLHYLQQSKLLGDELIVIVAHDDTVRMRKHEPVTSHEMRRQLVEGMKPVDIAIVGSPPNNSMFDIVEKVLPDIIALGYDQEHAEEWVSNELKSRGLQEIEVVRVEGLEGDLDGTRKIVSRILDLWTKETTDD